MMKKKSYICPSLDALPSIISAIYQDAPQLNIWILDGEMGAGKTTFVKILGEVLAWQDEISSPTFSIVNEYRSKENDPIYHFDFYRIEDETEALDIGVYEYFDSGNLCLIEWASKISHLLPEHYFHIHIETLEDQGRIITTQIN